MQLTDEEIQLLPPAARAELVENAYNVLAALQRLEDATAPPAPEEKAGGLFLKSLFGGFQRRTEERRSDLAELRQQALRKALDNQEKAAHSGSAVSAYLDVANAYSSLASPGVADPTGITFSALRSAAAHNEVVLAIHKTLIDQVGGACRIAKRKGNRVEQVGYGIMLADEDETPTSKDRQRMRELERFLLTCGSTKPPKKERPGNYRSSFETFTRAALRDRLTLDWTSIRFWYSAHDPDRLVAFYAEDAARIRRCPGTIVGVDHKTGKRVVQDYVPKRENTDEDIEYVAVADGHYGGEITDEFTEREMSCVFANPRTDTGTNGYGYSELEQALTAATIWIMSRNYNASRFRLDALPRGILTLFGNVDKGQLANFKNRWREMFQGQSKRWGFPIFTASTKDAVANWLPLDPSSRDMEYHQFLFSAALWMHALYGVHPEQTGFEALSPFRPPLSEASPDAKLQDGDKKGLIPLMNWWADVVNSEIMPKIDPEGRYKFVWMGLGQLSPTEDAEVAIQQLNAGQTTPRQVLAERDEKPVGWLKDCPVLDMPMPLMQGFQIMLQLLQSAQMFQQQQQAQAMQAAQAQQQRIQGMAQAQMGPGAQMGGDPSQMGMQDPSQMPQGMAMQGNTPDPQQFLKGLTLLIDLSE